MFELLNETLFEKHIAEYLAGSKMYNQRTPKDFNIQKLVDSDMLLQFLREQPMWQKLITQSFADEQDALNIVIETINTKINRGESLLSLLKNGFMLQGRRIRLAAFKPKMTLDDDDADHLYKKNIFSVVRQMKYSTQGFDKDNELDLCILLNGLPIITLELKNEATGQTVVKYIEYKNKTQEKCNYCTIYQCISGFYKKNVELHLLLILAIDSLIYSFYVTILLCKKAPVFD